MDLTTFQKIENVIKSIPSELLNEPSHTFTFNRMYRAYMSPESYENIPKVFGSSLFWRLKRYAKKVRKKVTFPKEISLPLPKDSIIFVRPEKNGIIALSYKKNLNVKVVLDPDFLFMLRYEIDALNLLKGKNFAPQIKGSSVENNFWLVTDCSLNTNPLLQKSNPEKYILQNFEELLLPKLNEFYNSSIYKKETFEEWLTRSEERIKAHPYTEILQRSLEKLKSLPVDKSAPFLISGMIHFDLHAGNILRDSSEKLTIVDWEGGARGLVMMDFFYLAKRIIKAQKTLRKRFVAEERDLEPVKLTAQMYERWLKKNFDIKLTPNLSSDVFSLVSLIEQALVLYEDRRYDLFEEKNGFEKEVFTSIL